MIRQSSPLRFLHQLTLVWLVVFLLVKLSPQYFAWQYPPASRHADGAIRSFRSNHPIQHLLIVVDKSISEDKIHITVPAAPCQGVLLVLFIYGLFIVLLRRWPLWYFIPVMRTEKYLASLCVFRL